MQASLLRQLLVQLWHHFHGKCEIDSWDSQELPIRKYESYDRQDFSIPSNFKLSFLQVDFIFINISFVLELGTFFSKSIFLAAIKDYLSASPHRFSATFFNRDKLCALKE